MITTKICNSCKVEKDVSEFYKRKNRSGNSGYSSDCKDCISTKTTNSNNASRSYIKSDGVFDKNQYNKKYREEHQE